MSPELKLYREQKDKAALVTGAFNQAAKMFQAVWQPKIKAAQSDLMTALLNMQLGAVIEETIGKPLSIAERLSLGDSVEKKVFEILPRDMVIELVKNPQSIANVVTTALDHTAAKTRMDTYNHDLSTDPRVTTTDIADGKAYMASFETSEELIQFMMEKFGVDRAKAEELSKG